MFSVGKKVAYKGAEHTIIKVPLADPNGLFEIMAAGYILHVHKAEITSMEWTPYIGQQVTHWKLVNYTGIIEYIEVHFQELIVRFRGVTTRYKKSEVIPVGLSGLSTAAASSARNILNIGDIVWIKGLAHLGTIISASLGPDPSLINYEVMHDGLPATFNKYQRHELTLSATSRSIEASKYNFQVGDEVKFSDGRHGTIRHLYHNMNSADVDFGGKDLELCLFKDLKAWSAYRIDVYADRKKVEDDDEKARMAKFFSKSAHER